MSDPMTEARQLQLEAAAEGFDWQDVTGAWDKLTEEVGELRSAGTLQERLEELGDLLFMVINLSRHLGVDAAEALAAANDKFRRRYGFVAAHLAQLPPLGDPARLERMEALWTQAKRLEKSALDKAATIGAQSGPGY